MKRYFCFSVLMILNIKVARAQEAYIVQPVDIKNSLL